MDDPAIRATGQLNEYAATGRRDERSMGEIMRDIMGQVRTCVGFLGTG